MKDWNLLKDREIIDLIIGDKAVIDDWFSDYRMPYMTGQSICDFAKKIGLNSDKWLNEKKSRWQYMEMIINYVANENKINLFFEQLFQLKRFRNIKNNNSLDMYSDQELYWKLIHGIMYKINKILFFEKCHIEYDLNSYIFTLVDDDNKITIEAKKIEKIDRQYIKKLKNQLEKNIESRDYESSITKSRTMIEEVMVYGIEKMNEIPTAKGNINKLYNQFKSLYSMHQNKELDNRINNLLSGLEKIITSISQMRDTNSDSHGVGINRITIEEHHVNLFANSAITISDFLLAVIEKNCNKDVI